jgi:hypothetical protein
MQKPRHEMEGLFERNQKIQGPPIIFLQNLSIDGALFGVGFPGKPPSLKSWHVNSISK